MKGHRMNVVNLIMVLRFPLLVVVLLLYFGGTVGRAVNPQMIKGQVGGGVHMGEGYAL